MGINDCPYCPLPDKQLTMAEWLEEWRNDKKRGGKLLSFNFEDKRL